MGGTDVSIKDVFERIGLFIEKNTGPILVVAVILILLSFSGAQRIEMASDIETYVEKESRLYQDFDLLYRQYFGTLAIVVLVENGDVTTPEVLHAIDRLDTGISGTKNVVGVKPVSGIPTLPYLSRNFCDVSYHIMTSQSDEFELKRYLYILYDVHV